MPRWAKIKEGPHAGQPVPTLDVNPAINLLSEPMAPANPYRSGYGAKIPTRHKVRVFDQRFRRVYVYQVSNAGTTYILYRGEAFAVTF